MTFDYKNATPKELEKEYQRITEELGIGRLLSRDLRYLPEILMQNEQVIAFSSGNIEGYTWLIALTDQRMLMIRTGIFGGLHEIAIDFDRINAVSCKKGLIYGRIIIADDSNNRVITYVSKHAVKFFTYKIQEAVERCKSAKHTAATMSEESVYQDLERIQRLKEKGALTEDEFQEHKEKLLAFDQTLRKGAAQILEKEHQTAVAKSSSNKMFEAILAISLFMIILGAIFTQPEDDTPAKQGLISAPQKYTQPNASVADILKGVHFKSVDRQDAPLHYEGTQPAKKLDMSSLSFDEIQSKAEQGNVNAQYALGAIYGNGDGVSQDFSKAQKWFLKASEQGMPEAQYALGVLYGRKDSIFHDYNESQKWFLKAAEQEHIEAQYVLGLLHYNTAKAEEDYLEAQWWFLKAANQGHTEAEKWYQKTKKHTQTPQNASKTVENSNSDFLKIRETLKGYDTEKRGKTSAQKKEIEERKKSYEKSLTGKTVQWYGWIDNVKSYEHWTDEGVDYKVLIDIDPPSKSFSIWDVSVRTENRQVAKLPVDTPVVINGVIKDVDSTGRIELERNVLKIGHNQSITVDDLRIAEEQKSLNAKETAAKDSALKEKYNQIEEQGPQAYIACKTPVKNRLALPHTAKFPWLDWTYQVSSGLKTATVRSHVDSQNPFGATIRTQFECRAQYLGEGKWRVESVRTF